MAVYVGVLGFFLVGNVFMTWKAFQLWRDPDVADFFEAAFTVLPLGPDARRGVVRSAGITVVTMWGVVLLLLAGTGGPVFMWIVLVDVLIILVLALCEVCVILFNVPKFAVPPHMRAEPGVFAARRARKAEGARRPGVRGPGV
ncbi:hypothetical protein [Streptomyces sp. NBC_00102]|uniref:hypothetical protein n=1 Tax=Streptomyces sp. NBC_00102 TaxID=2975652 RepID=UPI00224F2538|nr:hypothetical protein [Streptomyces sp. NBC_00102]MCX5395699.1 hypothetical protein [Streptomyces sp. NBC_00102]